MAWTENLHINPWCYVNSLARNPYGDPINMVAVTCRVHDDHFNANCVEWFQTIQQETFTLCLLDTREEVLSDDNWLESDRSD